MVRTAQQLTISFAACVAIVVAISGCSNSLSGQLLADGKSGVAELPVNSLVAPPAEILQAAVPAQTNEVEETALSPDVPTLADLSSRPIEGIDAPKVGLSIEQDVALNKSSVRWRGKRSADGVDLANSNGTLCSSSGQDSNSRGSVKMACSDGRVARLEFAANRQARLIFRNDEAETVQLD